MKTRQNHIEETHLCRLLLDQQMRTEFEVAASLKDNTGNKKHLRVLNLLHVWIIKVQKRECQVVTQFSPKAVSF